MNIHEYQGKQLFREAGVKVQDGVHCKSVEEALAAYDSLGSKVVAVKSQIHAGGRGKGNLYCPTSGDLLMEGGVKIAFARDEVETYAENILGHILVTKQTGPAGKLVSNLYVEAGCEIAHESYLALLVDREEKAVWPRRKEAWISKRLPKTLRKQFTKYGLTRSQIYLNPKRENWVCP